MRHSQYGARPSPRGPALAERHLQALEAILESDPLDAPELNAAAAGLAANTQDALSADVSLVALCCPDDPGFDAVDRWGARCTQAEISHRASLTVLEEVRRTGAPVLTLETEGGRLSSESLSFHEVDSIIAVPLFWSDLEGDGHLRPLRGVLYAHRCLGQPPFDQGDVRLMLNIARMMQPTLGLVAHLCQTRERLGAAQREAKRLRGALDAQQRFGGLSTLEPAYADGVFAPLRRAAGVPRVNLLLLGPTGAGKTHLAKAFHAACPRKREAFVTLDCGQVTSSETLASELFGYAPRSGYANAPDKGRPGKVHLAHGGVLFLDEIACLAPELQQRLLRLIETGTFSPLGSAQEVQADVQIIAATNVDLRKAMTRGAFREDLYWRLAEVVIEVPSLNAHLADVQPLADAFLAQAAARFQRADLKGLCADALRQLLGANWAELGNVRGLQRIVSRAALLAPQGRALLAAEDLSLPAQTQRHAQQPPEQAAATPAQAKAWPPAAPAGLRPAEMAAASRAPVTEARVSPPNKHPEVIARLEAHAGNLTRLASDAELLRLLGEGLSAMPVSTLRARLRQLNLLEALARARRPRHAELTLEAAVAAVKVHGTGTAAARALGVPRSLLVWRLREAGVRVSEVSNGKR